MDQHRFEHLSWQKDPPKGWNSFDAFGSSVTETEVLENAAILKARLENLGFDVVTIDYCWSHPNPGAVANPDQLEGCTPRLAMDEWGRLLPAPERFPSAAEGVGFKDLGDQLHANGQRFGLHLMRGIPCQAVMENHPILGGNGARAQDIAMKNSRCTWLNHMMGIDVSKPAGTAYYDSLMDLYASWGIDYLKADDLSYRVDDGYAEAEIEAIRSAIDKTGRKMVLSLSPGPAPLQRADHLRAHANLWRMSADFWDEWPKLRAMFELCEDWASCSEAGGWPDCDMLPIGPISQRGPEGRPRLSRFNKTELRTMVSLWSIFRSPLILGGDLRGYQASDWELLTNRLVLEPHHSGRQPELFVKDGGLRIWRSVAHDPCIPGLDSNQRIVFIGLFNLDDVPLSLVIPLVELDLPEACLVDLWSHERIETPQGMLRLELPAHGCRLAAAGMTANGDLRAEV